MNRQFHKLKLTLNTKNGITHTVHTRYDKLSGLATELLQRSGGNVKNIKLDDDNGSIELIGSKEEEAK